MDEQAKISETDFDIGRHLIFWLAVVQPGSFHLDICSRTAQGTDVRLQSTNA